jgi:multiple sugar transport system permease protein
VTLISLLDALPLYWMISGSFKSALAFNAIPPQIIPNAPILLNWKQLLDGQTAVPSEVWRWLLNSGIVSCVTVLISASVSCLMGYAFARKQFGGRRVLFLLVMATMMMPIQVIIVPLFILVRYLHLYNTYAGLIMPLVVSPLGIVLMRQFLVRLPVDLFDAGKVDGCSEWGQFWRIAMPLAKPAIAAVAIFTFFSAWNNFMWQLAVESSTSMMTLPVGVASLAFGASTGGVNYGVLMAGGTFGAVPMVLFFVAFQRYFVKGIVTGAVKG